MCVCVHIHVYLAHCERQSTESSPTEDTPTSSQTHLHLQSSTWAANLHFDQCHLLILTCEINHSDIRCCERHSRLCPLSGRSLPNLSMSTGQVIHVPQTQSQLCPLSCRSADPCQTYHCLPGPNDPMSSLMQTSTKTTAVYRPNDACTAHL